jgi:multidrug efflux pump subunit AcrB
MLHDLLSTIVIGFLLVTLILMFLGHHKRAVRGPVGAPFSMFLAFLVIPIFDASLLFTIRLLFAFLLALGIVVDAIVVIRNATACCTANLLHRSDQIRRRGVHSGAVETRSLTVAPFMPLNANIGLVHVLRCAHYHAQQLRSSWPSS